MVANQHHTGENGFCCRVAGHTPAPAQFKQDKTSANSPSGKGGPSCLDVFPSITDENSENISL